MPRQEEIRDISRFMDLDSEAHSIAQGNTRRKYNVLSDPRTESKAALAKAPGQREITNSALPPGDNISIGTIQNIKENTFFELIYNSNDNHCIFQFDCATEVYTSVLLFEPSLNFRLTNRITHGGVLGDLLFWTDGYDVGFEELGFNPPKQVNFKRAIEYTAKEYAREGVSLYKTSLGYSVNDYCHIVGYVYKAIFDLPPNGLTAPSGDETSNMYWEFIEKYNIYNSYLNFNSDGSERLKFPPVITTAIYASDPEYQFNNLRRNYFQFASRYQYVDKEYSVLSPFSSVPYPTGNEDIYGKTIESETQNNKIRVDVTTGTEDVIAVEIFCMDNESKLWKMVQRVDKYDADGYSINHQSAPQTAAISYDFFNDSLGFATDQDDVAKLFDGVPQISKVMEVIENNKIVDGTFTEGYDNVEIDINLILDNQVKQFTETEVISMSITHNTNAGVFWWTFTIPPWNAAYLGKEFRIIFTAFGNETAGYANGTARFTLNDVEEADYFDYVWGKFEELIPVAIDDYNPSPFYVIDQEGPFGSDTDPATFYIHGVVATNPTGTAVGGVYNTTLDKFSTFKHGAWQLFGIVYYDRGLRSGTNNISPESKVSIPHYSTGFGPSGNDFITQIQWEIKHRPPVWPTHYEWVWAKKSSYINMEQYYVAQADFVAKDEYIYININKNLHAQIELNKNINITPYLYAEGDRLKVIGKKYDADDWVILYDDVYDYPVLGEEITEDVPEDYQIFIQDFGIAELGEFQYILLEVYTPRKTLSEDDAVYYGFGEVFEIGNPHTENRYHKKGNDNTLSSWSQDQNPVNYDTTPARGVFTKGDAWVKFRWQYPKSVIVESINYSDFHDSNIGLVGRPSVSDRNSKRRVHENELIYGGQWFSGTDINDLNKVAIDGTNKTSVKERYGPITSLVESGYILRVRQVSKVTSIYLGRAGLTTASEQGVDVVVASNNVLGTHYYHAQDIGTSNPESCFSDGFGSHYFIDILTKGFMRDNNGGIVPLNVGMTGEINDIFSSIINSGDNPIFHGAFDSVNANLYVFYGTESNGVITYERLLVYHVGNQETAGYLSFLTLYKEVAGDLIGPDQMFSMNDKIYLSLNGTLWIWDDFDNPNKFFGVQHTASVEVVFNKNSRNDKNHMSLSIDAEEAWECPNYGDIKIPKSINYPLGMESLLKTGNFKSVENDYTAEFLKDSLTSSPLPPSAKVNGMNDLFNGRDMIGTILIVNLQNSTGVQSILRTVKVESFISKK